MSEFHWSRGSEDETQRAERGLPCGMTRSRLRRSSGAAAAMYLLWNATPELLTRRANTPSPLSCATSFSIAGTGPDTCTDGDTRHFTRLAPLSLTSVGRLVLSP